MNLQSASVIVDDPGVGRGGEGGGPGLVHPSAFGEARSIYELAGDGTFTVDALVATVAGSLMSGVANPAPRRED